MPTAEGAGSAAGGDGDGNATAVTPISQLTIQEQREAAVREQVRL